MTRPSAARSTPFGRASFLLLASLASSGCAIDTEQDPATAIPDAPTPAVKTSTTGSRSYAFTLDRYGRLMMQVDTWPGLNMWPASQPVTLLGAPTAVSWGKDRVDVFALTTAGMLQHYGTADAGATVYADNWGSMPGVNFDTSASCEVASWGVGRLDVFCVAWVTDRQRIVHRWYDSSTGGGWELLPALAWNGRFQTTGVTAASWGRGRLDVWLIDRFTSPPTMRHAGTSAANGTGGWTWDVWSVGAFTSDIDAMANGKGEYQLAGRCNDDVTGRPMMCHWTYVDWFNDYKSYGTYFGVEKSELRFDWSSARKPSIVAVGGGYPRYAIVDKCRLTILDQSRTLPFSNLVLAAQYPVDCSTQSVVDQAF